MRAWIEWHEQRLAKARHHQVLRQQRLAAARELGEHTEAEWLALLEFCGNRCVRCALGGKQHRDHIVPIYQGGSDAIENIQPLCGRCNCAKGPERVDYRPHGWRAFVAAKARVA